MARRFNITQDNKVSFADLAKGWASLEEAKVVLSEGFEPEAEPAVESGTATPMPFYTDPIWFFKLPKEFLTALRDHRLSNLERLHAPSVMGRAPCTKQCWGFLCLVRENINLSMLPRRDDYSGFLSAFSFTRTPPIQERSCFDPGSWLPAMKRFLPPQLFLQCAVWQQYEQSLMDNRGHVPRPPEGPHPGHIWSVFAYFDSFRLMRECEAITNTFGPMAERINAALEYHKG